MAARYVTLTLSGRDPEFVGTTGYVQVDDGPKVRISPEELGIIFQMAEELANTELIMVPVPGTDGEEESIRVPLQYPLPSYLPEACFAVPTQGGLRTIPGQIGALAMTVGGAEVLAAMAGVTTPDILSWAKEGVPANPAKVLLVRLGEDFGMDLSHIPTAKMITVGPSGGLQ